MIKKFLILFLFITALNANFINAISVVVNDDVITLYDIDVAMQKNNLSHNQAVAYLIDDTIYNQELVNRNIEVSDFEIEDYISKLAEINKLSKQEFMDIIKSKQDYNSFLKDIKVRLGKQKLSSQIATGKLKIATDEDIKLYYDNNIDKFKTGKNSLEVIPLETVKNQIFNMLMGQREEQFLKEYFDKLKITANIKVIR